MTAYEALRVGMEVAAILIAIASFLYAHFRTRDQAQRQEMEALQSRLSKAEARLEETPTSKALHELALSITKVGGDMGAMSARMEGLGAIVSRLEEVTKRQEEYIHDLHRKGGK